MRYVEFASGKHTLRGMLHMPAGKGPFPGVVMCHGFTASRMEAHFLFVTIARQLESLGLAVLRFDFAGSGESDGEFGDMTMSAEVDDAQAALGFLLRQGEIDPQRVGLLGYSLGGGVAAILAGRRAGDVRAVCLVAGTASPARLASFIRMGKHEAHLAKHNYLDIFGLKVSRAFLQDLEKVDPPGDLARYPGPVLLIHGDYDSSVPPSETKAFYDARTRHREHTRMVTVPNADHAFSSIPLTHELCKLCGDFFGTTLKE
jgi:dienelactone hydrolase